MNYKIKKAITTLSGFLGGGVLGGFLGLVIGGTFLGWINFREYIGMEGYELTFYIGAVLGSVFGAVRGLKFMS